MKKTCMSRLAVLLLVLMTVMVMVPAQVFAAASGTHEPVTGVTVSVSGATDNSMTDGAVTVTAKGSGGVFGIGASAKTATITIYNDLEETAELSFDWTATSVNALVIDGATYSGASGSFSKVLASGESFVVTITTAKNSTVNKLIMSNFAIVAAQASSAITFEYDSTYGNVTVDGTAVSTGSTVDIPVAGSSLVATTTNGGTFLGWVNKANNTIVSTSASYTYFPSADATIVAAFTKDTPWYSVGTKLFSSFDAAATEAAASAGKTMVLANNATLPAGNYTVPAGVTFLIPFNAANTVYTSEPGQLEAYTKPSAYRTLTMAGGANLTVNGSLCVGGSQSAVYPKNGFVSGPVGFIKMNTDSTITVNSGAYLYAWGYIIGSGSVTAKSGSTVYEDFQLADFRGGDGTSQAAKNEYNVFPMSQYYMQNVEVPLKLEAGASEFAFMSAKITLVGIQGTNVPVVGTSGAMFKLNSGYIIKDYIEGTGRIKFTTCGDIEMNSISMSMKLGVLGETTIDSANFNLPIGGHMTVEAVSGTVQINQDLALLPGSELYINEGVNGILGEGVRVIVYDLDQWDGYCGASNARYVALPYAPGGLGTTGREKDALIEVNGLIDASLGSVYTTTGGANIYSTGTGKIVTVAGTETVTYQIKQSSDGNSQNLEYIAIEIIPGVLKNGNGEYVSTSSATSATNYVYGHDVWYTGEHTVTTVTVDATCTETGKVAESCACGNYNKVVSEIAALGHTEETVAGKAATCTETGLTEGKKCTVCGETTVAQEEIAALGHAEEAVAGKAATCTETGLTEGKKCTVCGETTVAQEEIAALGHTEEIVAGKAATCTETGLTEGKKCTVCGETTVAQEEIAALGHSFVDGACTVCGAADPDYIAKFDIDVARMILGNALEFQFGVAKSKFTETTGYYALIEKTWADGTTTTETIPASEWGTAGQYWAIVYDGLAAKEMGDTFYVTIYNAKGQAISNAREDSVVAYVARAYNSQPATGKTMMVDMLNYGAAAQTHFDYGTDNLCNANLTDAQKAVATATAPEMSNDQVKGTNYQGTRFLLTSAIQVQLGFKKLTTDMYAVYTYTNAAGAVKEVRVEGADFVDNNGTKIGVELSALVYADARSLVTCTVYNADGTVYATASDSIESCSARSGATVFVELMKFADSAKEHLY